MNFCSLAIKNGKTDSFGLTISCSNANNLTDKPPKSVGGISDLPKKQTCQEWLVVLQHFILGSQRESGRLPTKSNRIWSNLGHQRYTASHLIFGALGKHCRTNQV